MERRSLAVHCVAALALLLAAAGCGGGDSASAPGDPGPGGDGGTGSQDGGDAGGRCVDDDDDGYGEGPGCEGQDCDDQDPNVHPDAPERCNGTDDDCDGTPDGCECAPYLGSASCPLDEHCTATGPDLLGACVPLPGSPMAREGEDCSAAACEPATHCVSWPEGERCTRTCEPYTGAGCEAPQECLSHLARNADVGLCQPPPPACDIYDLTSCAAGLSCRPLFRRNGYVDTRCQPAGSQDLGEVCGGNLGLCQAGAVCVRVPEAEGPACFQVCADDADCRTEGQTCTGRTYGLEIRFCR